MSPNGKVVYDNLRPIDLITNKALPPVGKIINVGPGSPQQIVIVP